VDDSLHTIRRLFETSVDHAHSVGPLTLVGRASLLVSTLRFFAAVGSRVEEEDPWHKLLTGVRHPREAESALLKLATGIEHRMPEIAGIFADLLLPSLRGIEELPIDWIRVLDPVGASLRENPAEFVRWFDSTVDNTIGTGASGLQYTTPRSIARLMVDLAAPSLARVFMTPVPKQEASWLPR
jgi:hypothetical protein